MILYSIHYSPWSLRVKWVAKHHGIEVQRREYVPMVSTPLVRLKVKDFSGKITMPLLIDGEVVLRDSFDISRHLDERGSGQSLFTDDEDVLDAWTTTANSIADAGRTITTYSVMKDPAARAENIPPQIRGPFRRVAGPIVDLGAQYLARKYDFSEDDIEPAHAQIRAGLERVANRLVESDHLGAQFGWPDIAMASALQFVKPAEGWVRLGEASSACWTRSELAREFADVLTWRDELLDAHRITRK